MNTMQILTRMSVFSVLIMVGSLLHAGSHGAWAASLSQGQTVYVPMYNAVRIGERGKPFPLAATLCIRNTDRTHPISVLSIDYYDTDGKLLQRFLGAPVRVSAMAVMDHFVKSSGMRGGLYPSFLVKWESAAKVSEPVIEAVFVGDRSGQGISFVTTGRVVEERSAP